jgi:hypothetical protein
MYGQLGADACSDEMKMSVVMDPIEQDLTNKHKIE